MPMDPTDLAAPRGAPPMRRCERVRPHSPRLEHPPRASHDPHHFPEGRTPVNTIPTAVSALRSVTRAAALVASLTLAACGSSQNWHDHAAYVTVGGTVTGLTGTVVLQNNGQDDLSVTANQAFTFGLS